MEEAFLLIFDDYKSIRLYSVMMMGTGASPLRGPATVQKVQKRACVHSSENYVRSKCTQQITENQLVR